MDAGDGVKRIGRADQPQQLAGRAGSLRELLLSRRSFSAFSCRYGLAEPQPQRHDEWTRTSINAWRVVLSMRLLNGSSSQPVARPVALPNPRRSGVRKTGAPSSQKGVRWSPPSHRGYTEGAVDVLAARSICGLIFPSGSFFPHQTSFSPLPTSFLYLRPSTSSGFLIRRFFGRLRISSPCSSHFIPRRIRTGQPKISAAPSV